MMIRSSSPLVGGVSHELRDPPVDQDLRSMTFVQVSATLASRLAARLDVGVGDRTCATFTALHC
jgi:hypothetical protein